MNFFFDTPTENIKILHENIKVLGKGDYSLANEKFEIKLAYSP
jgi:hypothetical protein